MWTTLLELFQHSPLHYHSAHHTSKIKQDSFGNSYFMSWTSKKTILIINYCLQLRVFEMVAQSGFEPLISSLWGWWVNQTSLPRKFFFHHLSFPMKTSPQNQPSSFVCHHCHLSCHQPIVAIKLHGPMPGELKEEKLTQASFNSLLSSSSCLSTTNKLQALHKKKAQLSSLWSAPGLMTS